MRRKYVLMYDPEMDGYSIARPDDRLRRFVAIDEIIYDDVIEGAVECQQLCNLMGEDAG